MLKNMSIPKRLTVYGVICIFLGVLFPILDWMIITVMELAGMPLGTVIFGRLSQPFFVVGYIMVAGAVLATILRK
jgi:hypothetical protein